MDQVKRGKDINFSDYVSREVPAIKNNTIGNGGSDARKHEFDTKLNNKTGLFSKLRDHGGAHTTTAAKGRGGAEIKYITDKQGNKKVGSNMHKTESNPHMPGFLKRGQDTDDSDNDYGYEMPGAQKGVKNKVPDARAQRNRRLK